MKEHWSKAKLETGLNPPLVAEGRVLGTFRCGQISGNGVSLAIRVSVPRSEIQVWPLPWENAPAFGQIREAHKTSSQREAVFLEDENSSTE